MKKDQKEIFLSNEGNSWFQRNHLHHDENHLTKDPVVNAFKSLHRIPNKVLEIGCSDGYRLNYLYKNFNINAFGIDPSHDGIEAGKKKFPNLNLSVGTADKLKFENDSFDLIILGFCLYLCDREDLFKIAMEADRCLQNQGLLLIYDFMPPFPYKNKYAHSEGVYCYKMDYTKMFSWNPAYTSIFTKMYSHNLEGPSLNPDDNVAVTILSKNLDTAYPNNPF
ncbi:MAG: class I SAM-dependent methyltransferase [Bdellovibrionales bacterium]|nr:class I SAM-dependent methyltransferase [Bdellovibrionales bacterium]